MITYILVVFGTLIAAYGVREWKRSRLISMALVFASAAGILMVLAPDVASALARYLGVGRGADLLLYCYSASSFIMIINLGLKQRDQQEALTQLARYISVTNPKFPPIGDVPYGVDSSPSIGEN